MVSVWARKCEKAYEISKEAGDAQLVEVPTRYYDEVVNRLVKDGIITQQ